MDWKKILDMSVHPEQGKEILDLVKECLEPALKEGESFPQKALDFTPKTVVLPLSKVLSKTILPFATQKMGGFDVDSDLCKERVQQELETILSSFDGIVFGVEAPEYEIRGEKKEMSCVVYHNDGSLSSQFLCSWDGRDEKAGIHLYVYAGKKIYIAHMSSGTMETQKASHNRTGLLKIIGGELNIGEGLLYQPSADLFFGDVNFDVTDPQNIETLRMFSIEIPVQFIFPTMRIRKKRISSRPFANNQVHKGGLEQVAESMIAVVPKQADIVALESQDLYVIREGQLYRYTKGSYKKLQNFTFSIEDAFSSAVLLDHKPIALRIDGVAYQFHNFMNFDGDRGFAGTIYDANRLEKAEDIFVEKLVALMTKENL